MFGNIIVTLGKQLTQSHEKIINIRLPIIGNERDNYGAV